MPCLLAILAVAFPRIAIILLWLFTNFFTGVYHGIIIPVLGFLSAADADCLHLYPEVLSGMLDSGRAGRNFYRYHFRSGPAERRRMDGEVSRPVALAENRELFALLACVALFRTFSAAIQGIDAHVIDVEVDMYPAGTNRDFVTVGMPDAAVRESRERIKSALLNSGFGYPSSR